MSLQQSPAASLIRRLLLVTLGAVSLFLFKGIDILSCSRAQEPAANSKEIKETVLKDEIPRHVPIRIKIKRDKEAAFKDLKNEEWARDFELEAMNIGEKLIYSLSLLLVTDLKGRYRANNFSDQLRCLKESV
ncbi:MAG TPA: hypothetical protein VGN86_17680 [Pyrinomonadaceae bacterium]|jgi:hypothetical protein|nr:hypothetical protein [Pyrinomonadaceae bacterium]